MVITPSTDELLVGDVQDSARHPARHHPHIALRGTATDVPNVAVGHRWMLETSASNQFILMGQVVAS